MTAQHGEPFNTTELHPLNTILPVLSHCAMNDTKQQVEANEKRCRREISGRENHTIYEPKPVVSFDVQFSQFYTISFQKVFLVVRARLDLKSLAPS